MISRVLYYTKISVQTLAMRLFSTRYLDKWCKEEADCDTREIIEGLMMWISKLAVFSWLPNLPEHDFGTIMANIVSDYKNSHGKLGFDSFFEPIFGTLGFKHFKLEAWAKRPHPMNVVPHPLNVVQLLVPNPVNQEFRFNTSIIPRNISGLAKFLLFPSYVETRAKINGISGNDVIKNELDLFPYTSRANFIVRYTDTFIMSHLHLIPLLCRNQISTNLS